MNHTMKNSTLTYHEIYGQPDSFQAILNTLPEIEATLDEVFSEKYDQLIFTGCGTSLYLAQTSAYLWRAMNSTPAEAVPCSELLFFPENYIKGKKTLVLPITRKSYTTEVRKAIDRVHELPGVTSLAITCDKDSRLYNEHYVLAPDTAEDSVIMTRSFTAMIFLAQILSMHVSGHEEWIKEMAGYREEAGKMLKECDALESGSESFHYARTGRVLRNQQRMHEQDEGDGHLQQRGILFDGVPARPDEPGG